MGWVAGTAFTLPAAVAYMLRSECTWYAPSAHVHPRQRPLLARSCSLLVGIDLAVPAHLPCPSPASSQTVHIHPSSGLSEIMPRWLVYHELGERDGCSSTCCEMCL